MTRGSHGSPGSDSRSGGGSAQALGLAGLIVLAEYLARRVLAPTLPSIGAPPVNSESLPIGAPVVNDMVATALIYGLLLALVVPRDDRPMAALGQAAWGIARQAATWLPWIGGVLFLAAVGWCSALSPIAQAVQMADARAGRHRRCRTWPAIWWPRAWPSRRERSSCPTLLVRAIDSQYVTREQAARTIGRLQDGRLIQIPESGHCLPWEQPERLLHVVRTFLVPGVESAPIR